MYIAIYSYSIYMVYIYGEKRLHIYSYSYMLQKVMWQTRGGKSRQQWKGLISHAANGNATAI